MHIYISVYIRGWKMKGSTSVSKFECVPSPFACVWQIFI